MFGLRRKKPEAKPAKPAIVTFLFDPKPDMTAQELAIILMKGNRAIPRRYTAFAGVDLGRHFHLLEAAPDDVEPQTYL